MSAGTITAWDVAPSGPLRGELVVNGDKSVSHRALLVGAVCDGDVRVLGFGPSADTLATLAAVRALGVSVDEISDTELIVHGVGLRALREPAGVLDVRNSGTLLRLLPGLLAVQREGRFTITGDESIRRRPMDRVAIPLALMGADIETANGLPPVVLRAGPRLRGIEYELPIASAQVKSCLLFAGIGAEGPTTVIERAATRDHTERMLRAAGVRVRRSGGAITVDPTERLLLDEIDVPGDPSSAAFLMVAATLVPESHVFLRGISVNAGRSGLTTVLERMGARIALFNRRTTAAGEPIADIEIRYAELQPCEIEPELVPSLIDELPIIALAASCARGPTRLRGLGELAHKETNRLQTTYDALRACGARIELAGDGWNIRGVPARLRGGVVEPVGDHRIAMLGAIAGLYSESGVRVHDAGCIDVSFPSFRRVIEAARGGG